MRRDAKIFVAGDKSAAGAAFLDCLRRRGFEKASGASEAGLDLLNQSDVFSFFKSREAPEYVFLAHVKSGGIAANISYPAEFIYQNLQVQNNIIHASFLSGSVRKMIFLASSCVYPKDCPQPMKEEYLFGGALEETSAAYATAKMCGIRMCRAYRKQYNMDFLSVIPATIYGPFDRFDAQSHVISSLMQRMHRAKADNAPEVAVWGTGRPRREFLYAGDLAQGCLFLMQNDIKHQVINMGCGEDIAVKDLAFMIKDAVGFRGEIVFDTLKPDGVSRKLLDSSRLFSLGWKAGKELPDGIKETYASFLRKETGYVQGHK